MDQHVTVDQVTIDNLQRALLVPCLGRFVGAFFAILGVILILCRPIRRCLVGQYLGSVDDTLDYSIDTKKEELRLIEKNSINILNNDQKRTNNVIR